MDATSTSSGIIADGSASSKLGRMSLLLFCVMVRGHRNVAMIYDKLDVMLVSAAQQNVLCSTNEG